MKAIKKNHVNEVKSHGEYCVVLSKESTTGKDIVWSCPECGSVWGNGYDNRGFDEETLSFVPIGEDRVKTLYCECGWIGNFENGYFLTIKNWKKNEHTIMDESEVKSFITKYIKYSKSEESLINAISQLLWVHFFNAKSSQISEMKELLDCCKILMKMADVPDLFIECPRLIKSRKPTTEDIKWAKNYINREI